MGHEYNARVTEVVEAVEKAVLDVIRTHRVTHAEYRQATDLVIDSIKSGEHSLLFDVFFEAEATDVEAADRAGSTLAIEGPFYMEGAPVLERPFVMPQREDEPGRRLVFRGTVTDTAGNPLPGAELDMWHADADGLYSNIHPSVPEWNLRGRFFADDDGSFQVETIVPPPYEIPKDGPTGIVLRSLGRHFFRPAHLHLKVSADGLESMTSQLYFEGDEYLDSDVANAVRDGLVIRLEDRGDHDEATYSFVLEAAAAPSHA